MDFNFDVSDLMPTQLYSDGNNCKSGFIDIKNSSFEVMVTQSSTERESVYSSTYLQHILQKNDCINKKNEHSSVNWEQDTNMTCLLVSHLKVIGWSKIKEVSHDFTTVIFQTCDAGERVHTLTVEIDSNYPKRKPNIIGDLPNKLEVDWSQDSGLISLIQVWEDELNKLQEFWNVLDEIDGVVYVLDPAEPSRKHKNRRLLLENNLSLILTISEDHARSHPQCTVLGTSTLATDLNAKLTQRYELWDPQKPVVDNIETLLEISLVKCAPGETSSTNAMGMMECSPECAICYTLRLNDALPDFICEHCQRSFHQNCLYTWLKSLTNSYQTTHLICGECPYCSKNIRVSLN